MVELRSHHKLYLISLDISSMTERSCWYLVWEAGSRAPLVEGMEREAGPVGVEGWGGRERPWRSRAEVGVLERLLNSFLPPLTLVRLVPAAARSCCCAGVRPETPLDPSRPELPERPMEEEEPIRLARSCCCWEVDSWDREELMPASNCCC